MEEIKKMKNMAMIKTPEQISEWLSKQKWIRAFTRNMREVGRVSKKEAMKILSGRYGTNTIAVGFDWCRTRQGGDYWHDKHQELINFYYHG